MSQTSLFEVMRAAMIDRPALSSSRGLVDGRSLLDSAERLALWLDKCGEPGPLVSAVAGIAPIVVTMLAADRSGRPVVHIDPGDMSGPDGLQAREGTTAGPTDYSDERIGLYITRRGHGTPLTGVPAGAQIFLTSGSSAEPVLVVRDAAAVLADARAVIDRLSYGADIPLVAGVPLHHVYGFTYGLVAPLLVGARVAYTGPRTVPSQLDRAIQQIGARILISHPAHFRMIAEQAKRTGSPVLAGLDAAVSAGAPLPEGAAAIITAYHEFALYNCYGSSEAGAITLSAIDGTEPPGDAGTLLAGVEARLAASGDSGSTELWLRTPAMARGYLRNAELVPLDMAGSWLRTGDLAELADNRIRLCGRISFIINVGGEKVAPEEIERVLAAHPQVADVEVRGEPDPIRGQQPVARLVLREAVSDADLLAWCRRSLAPMKVPRRFDRQTSLMRSVTGKRLRESDEDERE